MSVNPNPYSPPGAHVAQVDPAGIEFKEPSVFSGSGRIGRLRFLVYTNAALFVLYLALALVVAVAAGGAALASAAQDFSQLFAAVAGSFLVIGLLGLVLLVAFTVFFYMKVVQRSHDMGWSGWTALLTLLPLVVLIWYVVPGNPRTNAYGPRPTPNSTVVKIFGALFIGFAVLGVVLAVLGGVAGTGGN